MSSSVLVVLESTGKIAPVKAALRSAGLAWRVMATFGVIFRLRPGQGPLDPVEAGGAWQLAQPRAIEALQAWSEKADAVIAATDDDEQGEVIAHDLSTVLDKDVAWHPLRLFAHDAVLHALTGEAKPIDRNGISHRKALAMADFLIADMPGVPKGRIAPGRVLTPLLASFASNPIGPMDSFVRSPERGLLKLRRPMAPSDWQRASIWGAREAQEPKVSDCGRLDTVLALSQHWRVTPTEMGGVLQAEYEAGRMTYPRSGESALAASSLAKLMEWAGVDAPPPSDAAPALHGGLMPLERPSRSGLAMDLCARQWERLGLSRFGEPFGPAKAYQRGCEVACAPQQGKERLALDRLRALRLGTPATCVAHAERAARSVDEAMRPNAAARRMLDGVAEVAPRLVGGAEALREGIASVESAMPKGAGFRSRVEALLEALGCQAALPARERHTAPEPSPI